MHKAGSVALIATILLLIPSVAMANVGSPLIWVAFGHLLFGNIVFGLIEGLIIAGILRLDLRRALFALLWMILANYVSMYLGWYIISVFFSEISAKNIPFSEIPRVPSLFQSALVAAFFLTIILEWPFVLAAAKRFKGIIIKSLFACVVAQIVTYGILILLYAPLFRTSIMTVPDYQEDLSFAKSPYATVYYINPDDGTVWQVLTDGSGREQVAETEITDRWARLIIVREEAVDEPVLFARESGEEHRITPVPPGRFAVIDKHDTHDSWFANITHDLRTETDVDSSWEASLYGFWPSEGIDIKGPNEERYNLAITLPFGSFEWYFRSATMLPNDQVVFQFADWVVLLDMPTRKMGLIAEGRGPVVVIENE